MKKIDWWFWSCFVLGVVVLCLILAGASVLFMAAIREAILIWRSV